MNRAKKDAPPRFPEFREAFLELMGDMTLEQFAKKLGMSRATVGFYAAGQRIPDALGLKKITETCNVSADWLLGISDYKYKQFERMTAAELGLSEKAIFALTKIKEMNNHSSSIESLHSLLSMDKFYSLLVDISHLKKAIEDNLKKKIPAPFTNESKQAEMIKSKAENLLNQGGGLYKVIDETDYLKMKEYYLQSAFSEIVNKVIFDKNETLKQLLSLEQGIRLEP